MDDRTLLERAARAAGLRILSWLQDGYPFVEDAAGKRFGWSPLIFNSDAFWLAVRLEMDVFVRRFRWSEAVAPMGPACKEPHGDDPYAATRRAIVRAAAAMAGEQEGTNGA